jgi:hypothetical protein
MTTFCPTIWPAYTALEPDLQRAWRAVPMLMLEGSARPVRYDRKRSNWLSASSAQRSVFSSRL